MTILTTREDLILFMQSGVLSLSQYDLRFIQNLQFIVTDKRTITSNQATLFNKLIDKYQRQLTKHKYDAELVASLRWSIAIIDSAPKYTEAFISVEDDTVVFKSPFNRPFIVKLRESDTSPFMWNKDKRQHEAPFCAHAMKTIINLSSDCFPVVNYCPITLALLESILHYEKVKIWEPTLMKINSNIMIAASNEHVHKATEHIEFDITMKTLSLLTSYGVAIHHTIHEHNEQLEFASTINAEIDVEKFDLVIDWLSDLGCDYIYFVGHGSMPITHRKAALDKLEEVDIPFSTVSDAYFMFDKKMAENIYPVILQFGTKISTTFKDAHDIKKVVKFTNSRLVNIKGIR